MTDSDLFAWGCGVLFMAFGGAYTFVRERFLDGSPRAETAAETSEQAPSSARPR
ncbi:MAG: hypothetical protein FJ091_09430 [Deltaproteobacteria bacterium]|nr:hypothetical protein [Deltaproteobacteria bacterium]